MLSLTFITTATSLLLCRRINQQYFQNQRLHDFVYKSSVRTPCKAEQVGSICLQKQVNVSAPFHLIPFYTGQKNPTNTCPLTSMGKGSFYIHSRVTWRCSSHSIYRLQLQSAVMETKHVGGYANFWPFSSMTIGWGSNISNNVGGNNGLTL